MKETFVDKGTQTMMFHITVLCAYPLDCTAD